MLPKQIPNRDEWATLRLRIQNYLNQQKSQLPGNVNLRRLEELLKSLDEKILVIPAKAGIQIQNKFISAYFLLKMAGNSH